MKDFSNKTILVFGGSGFIGSNFIRYVFANYEKVTIINFDALTYSGNPHNLDDIRTKHKLIEIIADIVDSKAVEGAFSHKPDYVINFAAETHVDRSIHTGAKQFIDTNITGVFNILEAIKKYPVTKFVQVSTDEVYGEVEKPHKFTRQSPYKPNVPYSATKAGGDCLCHAYEHTWHVPVVVTHCTNNYGPYQYPEKLVPFWLLRISQEKKIPMYGDGMNVRDWIHVDDHIRGLIAVLLQGKPGTEYLFGADNEQTNMSMAELIIKACGELGVGKVSKNFKDHLEFVTDRPGHDRRYAIDYSDSERELGWKPLVTSKNFYEELKKTLAWYKDHPEWVTEVITRTGVANPHIDLWKGHTKS